MDHWPTMYGRSTANGRPTVYLRLRCLLLIVVKKMLIPTVVLTSLKER